MHTITISGWVDKYFMDTFGAAMPATLDPHLAERVDGFVATAKERIAQDMLRKAQERLDDGGRPITLHLTPVGATIGPHVRWDVYDEGFEDTYAGEVRAAFEGFSTDADWMQEVLDQWELVVAQVDMSRFGQVLVLGGASDPKGDHHGDPDYDKL